MLFIQDYFNNDSFIQAINNHNNKENIKKIIT